jgi:CheY-like chemotaxis protein/nitrogen-specific signal transduction histidine kinase
MRRIQAKLKQANQDLLAKNHEIQNFYHTLSHELKTPLTSAREFLSIMIDGLAGPLNETQLEYLGIAKDSCDQLRVCIDDLMDATRLETGKLAIELKPASLGTLVQRVLTSMRPAASEKDIALNLEIEPELPEVPLDENRISQVLTNLLSNAIKFTPARGKIVAKAGTRGAAPDLVQVSISDTGPGIPKEEQDRIFDRLYQVKAGDAANGQGLGLGLYLCRELVRLHGGNIWVESALGHGSTFSFVLPRAEHLLQSNLLVIDDDADIREMLRELLMAERYNVRTARNGKEGLQEMQRQVPDIVLLDLKMPDLDGPATLKEIRKNWGFIPVIVHTGFTDSELMKQALAFSPFTLLAKPCAADQVLETVRKVQQSEDTAIWRKNHFGLQKPRF